MRPKPVIILLRLVKKIKISLHCKFKIKSLLTFSIFSRESFQVLSEEFTSEHHRMMNSRRAQCIAHSINFTKREKNKSSVVGGVKNMSIASSS